MKIVLWIMVGISAVVLIIYGGASSYFSNVLIDRETSSLADSAERMQEAGVNLELYGEPEAVAFEGNGKTLVGDFYENPAEGECAVMLLHGYTGTRFSAMQYAPLFWERGCDLMAYDARGHGASEASYHTYGYYEKEDAVAGFEWLKARAGLTDDQIGLVGVSYGAATSLQAAPLLPEAAFVLADSAYSSLPAIVEFQGPAQFGDWILWLLPGTFALSEMRADFDVEETSPVSAVADADLPILLIHSLQDAFTPAENTQEIYDQSDQTETVMYLTDWGAEHGASIFVDYESYKFYVDDFLATYVPDFGTAVGR